MTACNPTNLAWFPTTPAVLTTKCVFIRLFFHEKKQGSQKITFWSSSTMVYKRTFLKSINIYIYISPFSATRFEPFRGTRLYKMQRFLGLEHLSLRKMASGGSLEEPFLSRHQPRTSVYHHLQIFTNVLGFWSGRLLCALKRWQVTIGYHRLPQVTTLHRSCKISQWASGSPQGPHRVPTHIAPDIRHFD